MLNQSVYAWQTDDEEQNTPRVTFQENPCEKATE
jgi:hypothetical protein